MNCNNEETDSLREFCSDLLLVSSKINDIPLSDNDHFSFMSLCYLRKQFEHMEAIFKLYPHPDIQLISRTMIEGLSQILWCNNNPDKAFQWRAFSWISDWRQSKLMKENGMEVSEERIKNIDNFLKEHGDLFKKRKPSPNGDPYHLNWKCGKSIKDITTEVKGDALYEMLYSQYSDWQHWGVTSIGQMVKRDENKISYGESSQNEQLCAALGVAFLCLYQMLELVDKHHNIGISNHLIKIRERYIEKHSFN